ncbi:hypothetical protein N182_34885 [Sinorhizobium sp. GL2]|nr:hypothetical protein N182_34885 [Sinorhizobium sp. GL2]
MKREEIERLRETIVCQAVLETSGFALDLKESTRRAMKYRRGGEIIIVTHSGRGWFDPLSDEKGDVFGLMTYLQACDFLNGCARVAALTGFSPSQPIWHGGEHWLSVPTTIPQRWARRKPPWPGPMSRRRVTT